MTEHEQDPSANTGRFRAFVQEAEEESASKPALPRGVLITVGILAVVVVVIILAAVL